MTFSYAIWAIAVVAVCLGWAVVWQEVSARSTWRYRIWLTTLWLAVTFIVGDWWRLAN